jgi:hypothetical protein
MIRLLVIIKKGSNSLKQVPTPSRALSAAE